MKTPTKRYELPVQIFDAYSKELSIKQALGSKRGREIQEISEIRSTNFKTVAGMVTEGWRLTRRGIEIAGGTTFPPGFITFTDIQNIATDKILGRDTAGSGSIEQLGLGAGLSISGGNLVVTITQYTDEMAQDAVGNAVGNGLDYDDTTGAISVDETEFTTILSGTYTPTRSAESNLDSNVTMFQAQYMRVGNTVTVSGRFTADPTTTLTATSFEMTLPVASNIGAVEDVAGVAFCGAIAGQGAQISGSVANDTAVVTWNAVDVTSQSWSFSFSYQVI